MLTAVEERKVGLGRLRVERRHPRAMRRRRDAVDAIRDPVHAEPSRALVASARHFAASACVQVHVDLLAGARDLDAVPVQRLREQLASHGVDLLGMRDLDLGVVVGGVHFDFRAVVGGRQGEVDDVAGEHGGSDALVASLAEQHRQAVHAVFLLPHRELHLVNDLNAHPGLLHERLQHRRHLVGSLALEPYRRSVARVPSHRGAGQHLGVFLVDGGHEDAEPPLVRHVPHAVLLAPPEAFGNKLAVQNERFLLVNRGSIAFGVVMRRRRLFVFLLGALGGGFENWQGLHRKRQLEHSRRGKLEGRRLRENGLLCGETHADHLRLKSTCVGNGSSLQQAIRSQLVSGGDHALHALDCVGGREVADDLHHMTHGPLHAWI
mmetsp:Transcript_35612/g.83777  ORF Transcript_35612/g.83777 Transcript_35612/m.83777 type:complete len:378 (-) Transcript_35612:417-1550(-)